MARKTFFTVGYERTTLAGLIAALQAAGVSRVIDTRDVANSRRAGFSKKLLAASLDEEGIGYIHLRALGTPKAGREANRAGRMDEFWKIYEASFQQPEAQLALLEAADLIRAQPSALLCFCGDSMKCHRHRIAQALEEKGFRRKEIAFE
ncbi:MAG: DUF488 domain-containing protein [Hyphomonadaceae bacterium]|nr:DUF488 domain-containing protein [Hyphomonadaceae bacterium]